MITAETARNLKIKIRFVLRSMEKILRNTFTASFLSSQSGLTSSGKKPYESKLQVMNTKEFKGQVTKRKVSSLVY